MSNPVSRTLTLYTRGLLLAVASSFAFMQGALAQTNASHHQDYLAALEKVGQAETRIADEMQRVQSGTVAHYDFLQYEHIELVRHARALAYPPKDISAQTRAAITSQAEQLLASANALELVIADFLRAYAQVRGATANTLDLAAILKRDAASGLAAELAALETRTAFLAASGYQTGWDEFVAAFETVQNSVTSDQYRRELAVQKQMLEQNIPALGIQRQKLMDSDVDARALALKDLYGA